MARSNKHDAHKEWILQRLQASPNVRQLVRDLAVERGLKTTDTEVNAWLRTLQRQRARSAVFAALIPDSAGPPGASIPILDNLAHTLRTFVDLTSAGIHQTDVNVNKTRNSKQIRRIENSPNSAQPTAIPPRPAADVGGAPAAPVPPRSAFPPASTPSRLAKTETRSAEVPPESGGSIAMNGRIGALAGSENSEAIQRLERAMAESQSKESTTKKPWERT